MLHKTQDSDLGFKLVGCAFQILVYLILLILGAFASNWLIMEFFNDNISFFYDLVISFLSFPVILPFAIIWWILKHTGVI
jgi:hypothetical protein